MCWIVAAALSRNVSPILIDGLKRLEYRGYDSAGIATIDSGKFAVARSVGKVALLEKLTSENPHTGQIGIAHTRWATHGSPSERNSHPHSALDIAVVHNGIIENYQVLKAELIEKGVTFLSDTDTEVIAQLIAHTTSPSEALTDRVREILPRLKGAYALAIISEKSPDEVILTRRWSPLVVGVGIGEYFAASDPLALIAFTSQFISLEEGDTARMTRTELEIIDEHGKSAQRPIRESLLSATSVSKEWFSHFMEKEIYEQSSVIADALSGRVSEWKLLPNILGSESESVLKSTHAVQIVACGTSAHAGMVVAHMIEGIAGIECRCELASEYRYQQHTHREGTLLVGISQSGETADTLEALRYGRSLRGVHSTLALCNSPESTMVREAKMTLMTRAGREQSVASTKAFTTQITCLMLLTLSLAKAHGHLTPEKEEEIISSLQTLPSLLEKMIPLWSQEAKAHAGELYSEKNALYLGRGELYPLALEWALKLKEIAYIHAEGYAAGELKHGPLALIEAGSHIIALAQDGPLLPKMLSNIEEVRSRWARVLLLTDAEVALPWVSVWNMPKNLGAAFTIAATIPLQLLAYQSAVLAGSDVDQPRNLAKSVTVE